MPLLQGFGQQLRQQGRALQAVMPQAPDLAAPGCKLLLRLPRGVTLVGALALTVPPAEQQCGALRQQRAQAQGLVQWKAVMLLELAWVPQAAAAALWEAAQDPPGHERGSLNTNSLSPRIQHVCQWLQQAIRLLLMSCWHYFTPPLA